MEIMVKITGYPDYTISKNGEIYSTISGKYLTPCKRNKYGYQVVRLKNPKTGKFQMEYVHRLMLLSWKKTPVNYVCDHIDGNKANNKLENLRWVTDRQNIELYQNDVLKREMFSYKEIKQIWVMRIKGWSYRTIAAEFFCSAKTIQNIVKGKIYKEETRKAQIALGI